MPKGMSVGDTPVVPVKKPAGAQSEAPKSESKPAPKPIDTGWFYKQDVLSGALQLAQSKQSNTDCLNRVYVRAIINKCFVEKQLHIKTGKEIQISAYLQSSPF